MVVDSGFIVCIASLVGKKDILFRRVLRKSVLLNPGGEENGD